MALAHVVNGAIAVSIVTAYAVTAGVIVRLLFRAASDEPGRSPAPAVSDPWNDVVVRAGTARITALAATDEEMLLELRWTSPPRATPDETGRWLVGPGSQAAMITLSRWLDGGVPVLVSIGPRGVLLESAHARANLRTARTSAALRD